VWLVAQLKDLVAELFPGEEYDAHWAAARQQAGEEPAASQQEEAQQQAQQEREEQQRQQGAKRKIARAGECNGRRSPTPPAAGEPAAEPAAAASAEGVCLCSSLNASVPASAALTL
jgi:FtsZ-interacting cell division protein YlmF